MTTLRQAAEQALEALKMAQKAMGLIGADLVCEAAHHEKKDRHQIGEPCPIQARWHQAFAAIREALAEHPAQQEPVAWLWELTGEVTTDPDRADGMWLPLYTSPPASKPWVGLTDEERNQVAWSCGAMSADWLEFVDAIEAKLREKNT